MYSVVDQDKILKLIDYMDETRITHIEELEIENLWGKYDIKWKLNPKVNILLGANGSGKSTILNVIETLLVEEVPLEGFEKGFLYLVKIGFNDERFLLQDGQLYDNSYNIYRYDDLINFTKISTFDMTINSRALFEKSYGKEVQTGLDVELYQAINDFKSYQLTLAKMEKAKTILLEEEIKKLINDSNSREEDLAQIGKLYKEIDQYRRGIYAKRDLFLDMIDELFAESKKSIDFDEHNSFVFYNGEKLVKPYQLSSGEKQMLLILLKVVVQNNEPYILMMDEPEISLDLNWQYKLIDMIIRLNENLQLIIATHSPGVFSRTWRDYITRMEEITFERKK